MAIRFDTERIWDDAQSQGMTQTDLADKSAISRVTIHYICRGLQPSPKHAKRIAKALGFDLSRYVIEEVA